VLQSKGEVISEILQIMHYQALSKAANCEISLILTEPEVTEEYLCEIKRHWDPSIDLIVCLLCCVAG
jgi:hypothetical protein